MNKQRISVITPVYNAERYVAGAIASVLSQTMDQWELLIVDDGSTDNSRELVQPFLKDPRVRYFHQARRGVSAARNVGLDHATGDWICFLDADDELYPNSLCDRLEHAASDPGLRFIDGTVRIFDESMARQLSEWAPTFRGQVFDVLLFDTARCFVGVTWMVRNSARLVRFREGLTHGEDLLFFIMNSGHDVYGFVDSPIVKVRRGHVSAMTNLIGLEQGYRSIHAALGKHFEALSSGDLERLRARYRRILVKSHLRCWNVVSACRVLATF